MTTTHQKMLIPFKKIDLFVSTHRSRNSTSTRTTNLIGDNDIWSKNRGSHRMQGKIKKRGGCCRGVFNSDEADDDAEKENDEY